MESIKLPEWNLIPHVIKIIGNNAIPDTQKELIWSMYHTIWRRCNMCTDIFTDRKVYGDGNTNADVMIIGEGPGENEELQLKPFVGAAGKILNNGLRECGITRGDLYITNTVLCRCAQIKEGGKIYNRPPTEEEMGSCRARLEAEIALVSPKMIIVMGESAWKSVTGGIPNWSSYINKQIEIEYSTWDGYRQQAILIATYHTAALLHNDSRNPEVMKNMKYTIGDTFQMVNNFINELNKERIQEAVT